MTNWHMAVPNWVISGKGVASFLPKYLKKMKLCKPFVILDPIVRNFDFGRQFYAMLGSYGAEFFSDFSTNPNFSQVNNGLISFSSQNFDSIISVGGGSAIDIGKVIGMVAANGGDPQEYFCGKTPRFRPVPLFAIPTTCGTGAESSPFAVILDPDIPKKRGIESLFFMPSVVILDSDSLLSLDRVMIAATGMDTFSHILESHISSRATNLTRVVTKGLLYSIRQAMEKSIDKKDEAALETLHSIAFTSRLLYPRTGLSIAHALSHPFGAFTNIHHGLAVSLFIESSIIFNYSACEGLLYEVEEAMGLSHDGNSLVSWIKSVIFDSGAGNIISKYVNQFDNLPIDKIAADALHSSNIPSNPKDVKIEDVCKIVENSFNRFADLEND